MSNAIDDDMAPRSGGIGAWIKRFAVVLIAIGVLVGGFVGCQALVSTGPRAQNKTTPPAPPAVQVAKADTVSQRLAVNAQGEVAAKVAASLAAQVSGRIVWISPSFVEGGAFRQGDVLVRIDDADYRLAVVRARSQVAQAREGLAREEAEGELARRDWEALGKGEASPLALREPQLAQAKAALAAAEAQQQDAELDLSRASIRAPFSGRVRARRANLGDFVSVGIPVADVFATDIMEIRVALSDADLATLNVPLGYLAPASGGPPAEISATVAGKPQRWTGRLARIEANVDARSRQAFGVVEVKGAFGGAAPLAPGLFVDIALGGGRQENFVSAPRSALKRNEFLYVVRADGTIDVRNVRPAQTTAETVLLRDGLQAGEMVVTSTLASPRQGMRVSPIDAAGVAVPVAAQKKTAG